MFDKEVFAEVLKLARGERSNQQFADDTGVSRPYISMLLNQKREDPPTTDILKKFSTASHNSITYTQLMVAAGYVYWTDEQLGEIYEVKEAAIRYSENMRLSGLGYLDIPDRFVWIPVLGAIPAGRPLEAVEDIVGHIGIPEFWQKGGRKYFGLTVKGDSMYPDYMEGDIVIIRQQATCDNRDDCVIILNDDEPNFEWLCIGISGWGCVVAV